MKLKKMSLVNFQAHAKLEVEFAADITTIKGPTDAGKSAILRALRWVCLNDLGGDEFIREGSKRTRVTLFLEDGSVVVREKGRDGASNTYALDDHEYKAFGTGVPQEIARVLGLSEINFQAQHDSPFWFSETAGEVSRRLNAVIDLSIIDTALGNVSGKLRTAQERLTVSKERLAQAEEASKELQSQRQRIEDFSNLELIGKAARQAKDAAERLEKVLEEISNNQYACLTEQTTEGEAVLITARRLLSVTRKQEALENILGRLEQVRKQGQEPPPFHSVSESFENYRKLDDRVSRLSELLTRIGEQDLAVDALWLKSKTKQTQFTNEIKGKACPLCGKILQ